MKAEAPRCSPDATASARPYLEQAQICELSPTSQCRTGSRTVATSHLRDALKHLRFASSCHAYAAAIERRSRSFGNCEFATEW